MATPILWAQIEDEEEEAVPAQPQFEIAVENFDQWVYSNMRSAQAVQQKFDSIVQLRIRAIDDVCHLSEDQKQKIQLAGRGDIRRFFNRVEEVRKKFMAVRHNQNRINEVWQDIQPLQTEIQAGIFNDKSLVHKVLFRTLDTEQWKRYAEAERDRRRFHYEAKIGHAILTLEKRIPLEEKQRQEFTALLKEETEPPLQFGEYDYYVVLLKASHIPESKLKPIFDDVQWQEIQQLFAQARGLERHLRKNGFIP